MEEGDYDSNGIKILEVVGDTNESDWGVGLIWGVTCEKGLWLGDGGGWATSFGFDVCAKG